MAEPLLSRSFILMHSPSILNAVVAEQQIADHIATAGAQRTARRLSPVRVPRIRGRRSGAPSSPIVPRGRTFPPFAH